MASSWKKIAKVDASKITDEDSDQYYDTINDLDPNDVEDIEILRQGFEIAQVIMTLKAEQNKILEEDLLEFQKKAEQLEVDKKELESENKDLQRLRGGDVDDREIFQERRNWEVERENMDREIEDLTKKLSDITKKKDNLEAEKSEMTRDLERLREENSNLSESNNYLKNQFEEMKSKQSGLGREDLEWKKERIQLRSELRAKNGRINNLEEENHKLEDDVERLEELVTKATADVEKATDDYAKMKSMLTNSDHLYEQKVAESDLLKQQVANLSAQLQSSDMNDEIMVHLNNKVEEWKECLAQREEEIYKLHQENLKLKKEVQASNLDSERATVQALSNLLKDKDKEIKLLKENLQSATRDIESQVDAFSSMKRELDTTGKGPSDRQATRIRELAQIAKEKETLLKQIEERREQAETAAAEKDKELVELSERMRLYEAGEYGLSDAVAEIKQVKAQMTNRERQIEELCQKISETDNEKQYARYENEHLRTKLGIPLDAAIDIEGYRKQKLIDKEENQGQMLIMQKEIENLEDERLQLKKKIRILARQAGHKAGSTGIPVDALIDMDALDAVDEQFTSRSMSLNRAAPIRRFDDSMQLKQQDSRKIKEDVLSREVLTNVRHLDEQTKINLELQARNDQLIEENDLFVRALNEIKSKLVKGELSTQSGAKQLEIASLDKLLAVMDSRRLANDFDSALYMKARVDNLEGRNDELRQELRELRIENGNVRSELERTAERMKNAEEELRLLNGLSGNMGQVRTTGLPENMTKSSQDTIAYLNEHLIQTLHELDHKEEELTKLSASVESYRRKFALARHQQGNLYQEFLAEKKAWEKEKSVLEAKMKELDGQRQEDQIRIEEFNRLRNDLASSPDEIQRRLGELTRQITVLRVNEKALVRRYEAMADIETQIRRENTRLKNEIIQMEATVMERLGYYQRFKDMCAFKIEALQRALDESVPEKDFVRTCRQLDELKEKYRSFLDRQNSLISNSATQAQLEAELKETRLDNVNLKTQMEIEKERRLALEVLNEGKIRGGDGSGYSPDHHQNTVAKRTAMLEMKELNERERANHAQRMYDSLQSSLQELDRRNKELEMKFADLTKLHLEQQKIERELRDQLLNTVSKEISDSDKKRILDLKKSEMILKHEVDKQREISEIATNQARTLQEQQISRDKEVTSLRQQLLDIQCQSDEKAVIGKLHRHIVALQLSEATALRIKDEFQRKLQRVDSSHLRLEKKMDDKDMTFYHFKLDSRARTKYLKDTINSLRSQYAGSVPLTKQEKLTKTLMSLQEDKKKIQEELKSAEEKRMALEDENAAVKLKLEGLHELKESLNNPKGSSSKIVEWHNKMEKLRLEEMKEKRQVERLRHQLRHLESVIKCQETQLLQLEEENARQAKLFEEQQLAWEQRESEMERMVDSLENHHGSIMQVSAKLQNAPSHGNIPNPSLPLPQQLSEATDTIKKNLKTIFDQQAENNHLKNKNKELVVKINELEKRILEKDHYITQMRLRLPATTNRDPVFNEAHENVVQQIHKSKQGDNYVEEKTLETAQTTIVSLQERLQNKEEALVKYKALLKETREEAERDSRNYVNELRLMQEKLAAQMDGQTDRLKKLMEDINRNNSGHSLTENEMRQKLELKELLAEQTRENSMQAERLRLITREMEEWKHRYNLMMSASDTDKRNLDKQMRDGEDRARMDADEFRQKLVMKEQEIEAHQREIHQLKDECKKSPSQTMKHTVTRLKEQLMEKDKQLKTMSQALVDLRKDLVNQAEESAKYSMEENQEKRKVQQIIDKHTKDLGEELESFKSTNEKLKRDVKKLKEDKQSLQGELDELQSEAKRKDGILSRAKTEKQTALQEVDDLRSQIDRLKNRRNIGSESDDLRRQIRVLEEENKRYRLAPERPYENEIRPSNSEALTRWEEGKKANYQTEKFKDKLRAKEEEMKAVQRQLDLTKNELARANKLKEQLQARLVKEWGPGALPFESDSIEPKSAIPAMSAPDNRRELMEMNAQNRILEDRINDLERQLLSSGQETNHTLDRDRQHQKELIRLNQENMSLRFEVESIRKEVPRLQEKIQDLQKHIEVLKSERLDGNTNRSMESTSSLGLRKIGESGRTPKELEKLVARMKKVVERTKEENERLKCAPGIVSNEQLQFYKTENDSLKDQVANLKAQMGQKLTDRYDTKEKATTKLMSDYDKLRMEYTREINAHEKTRQELRRCEAELEISRRQAFDEKAKREIEVAKKGENVGSLDGAWNSAVSTRMYESKLKDLDQDLSKKNQQLSDLKTQLKASQNREEHLQRERSDLLHDLSQSARGDVEQELYRLKSKLEKLEAENRHLSSGQQISDPVMKQNHEELIRKNEYLENQLKHLSAQFGISVPP